MSIAYERKGRLPNGYLYLQVSGDVPQQIMIIVSDYTLVEKSPALFMFGVQK